MMDEIDLAILEFLHQSPKSVTALRIAEHVFKVADGSRVQGRMTQMVNQGYVRARTTELNDHQLEYTITRTGVALLLT